MEVAELSGGVGTPGERMILARYGRPYGAAAFAVGSNNVLLEIHIGLVDVIIFAPARIIRLDEFHALGGGRFTDRIAGSFAGRAHFKPQGRRIADCFHAVGDAVRHLDQEPFGGDERFTPSMVTRIWPDMTTR